MKKVIIILDGVSDIGAKTSLALSKHPNLDFFAKNSLIGLMYPVKGLATESGLSQFMILGYPKKLYPGRGVLEALGVNLKINPKNTYLRCNFMYIKNRTIEKRAKIPDKKIIRKLNQIDKDIKIIPTIDYRGIMIIKNSSPNITATHPGYIEKAHISKAISSTKEKQVKGDKKTAQKINNFIKKAKQILKDKTIVIRGASNSLPKVKKLKNWSMIADMPIEIGLGKLFRMKILSRKNEIKQVIDTKTNIYVQIKGPDIYGHLGDLKKKISSIEKIDKMLAPLKKLKNTLICITSDHSTPYQLKRHSKDPVPILIYPGKGNIKRFTEQECKKTGFKIEGKDLMKFLNSLT